VYVLKFVYWCVEFDMCVGFDMCGLVSMRIPLLKSDQKLNWQSSGQIKFFESSPTSSAKASGAKAVARQLGPNPFGKKIGYLPTFGWGGTSLHFSRMGLHRLLCVRTSRAAALV